MKNHLKIIVTTFLGPLDFVSCIPLYKSINPNYNYRGLDSSLHMFSICLVVWHRQPIYLTYRIISVALYVFSCFSTLSGSAIYCSIFPIAVEWSNRLFINQDYTDGFQYLHAWFCYAATYFFWVLVGHIFNMVIAHHEQQRGRIADH